MTDRRQEVMNVSGGVVAAGLIGILAFMTWALVYVAVPPANQNALTVLIGILSANVGMVVGFYFGSSQASRKQTDAIQTLASTVGAAQAALPPVPGATANADLTLKPGDKATIAASPEEPTP